MFGIGASKAVIGLDVGSYAIKAVALQTNRDRITLQGYAQARIGDQDVGEVIRSVMAQLGVKSRKVVTSVSGRSVIVRQVETPKLPEAELKAHIAYEADKYIPFGSEEVIIDCQPIQSDSGGETPNQQVMLVAVRKSFIQEHLAQLRSAHLLPDAIDVDVFALANAYELLGPPMPPENERKAVALIDIGASKSNIAILQAGRVLFTREIYLAGNEISDAIARTLNESPEDVDRIKLAPGEALDALIDAAMPAFEDLANEIRLSFDYVEGQFETEVATVVLTGGSAQLPQVAEILGNILGRPVNIFDPLAGLDLVPSKYDIHGLDANSPGLTVALGLAAHVLAHPTASLGGAQSLAWQPRQRGDGAAAEGIPAIDEAGYAQDGYADGEPGQEAATAPTMHMDAGQEAEPVFAEPSADAFPPPAEPPPQAMPTITPVAFTEEDEAGLDPLVAPEVGHGSTAKHRSTLLVVLDEDQDAARSDRYHVGQSPAVATNIATSMMPPGSFDISSQEPGTAKESRDIDLPDLPDLPPPKRG